MLSEGERKTSSNVPKIQTVLTPIKPSNSSLETSLFGKRQLSGSFGESAAKYLKICEREYGLSRLASRNGRVATLSAGANRPAPGDTGTMQIFTSSRLYSTDTRRNCDH